MFDINFLNYYKLIRLILPINIFDIWVMEFSMYKQHVVSVNEREKERDGEAYLYHWSDELNTGILDIPAKFGDGPSDSTKNMSILYHVIQITFVAGGLV